MTETVTVRKDDLPWPPWLENLSSEEKIRAIVRAVAACLAAHDGQDPPGLHEQHCTVTMAEHFLVKLAGEIAAGPPVTPTGDGSADTPTYPPGEFARVELPGYVAWTGWVSEETFAGAGVLVVRDISGTVQARVSAGAFRQVIPLGLPRPGETAIATAIEAGGDAWADDEEPF